MKAIHFVLPLGLGLVACHHDDDPLAPDATASSADAAAEGDAAPPPPVLPRLQLCAAPDPDNIRSAYTITQGADWVHFDCVTPCDDWTTCTYGLHDPTGNPLLSSRGDLPIQGVVFTVDGMAGHFTFTSDGNDVVITHAGSGGTTTFNSFDRALQANSDLKTVSLGWDNGSTVIFNGAGWFTRTSAPGTTVRALAARPAAAIQWVKDHFAVGKKLGTVGSSMGTAATFGAHVWYGLDPILDYQMLIGGPGFWDVNAGCGRVHLASGYCDVDASACTGNAFSRYGDDDPACGEATNQCRVPTIMAPTQSGSAYNACINYVGATTACAEQTTDARDASLDDSSLAFTVASWSFRGRVDLIADEGGIQPPDADQGMGEGHMLQIYAAITSAKTWIDNEGTHHGDAWTKTPALVTDAAMRVIDGMSQ